MSWTMSGTEGTGEYIVVTRTGKIRNSKVGVRLLPYGAARVRVEPRNKKDASAIAEVLTRSDGWKQPGDGGQNRFSTVAHTPSEFGAAVNAALRALRATGRTLRHNPKEGNWRKRLAEHTA